MNMAIISSAMQGWQACAAVVIADVFTCTDESDATFFAWEMAGFPFKLEEELRSGTTAWWLGGPSISLPIVLPSLDTKQETMSESVVMVIMVIVSFCWRDSVRPESACTLRSVPVNCGKEKCVEISAEGDFRSGTFAVEFVVLGKTKWISTN